MASSAMHTESAEVHGDYVLFEGEQFYKISHHDQFSTFFISVVSSGDHWMFISSNGALTAGRKNPESALFPYYTDDKIMDSPELSGSKTIIKVKEGEKMLLWEPFSERFRGVYRTESNIYKNKRGNKLMFEEINHDLEISFSYMWTFADQFGFCKRSQIKSLSDKKIDLEILDGIRNIMPYGISSTLQNQRSTLADAYKRNELDSKTGLGIFSLSSMIVDKAEPSEALRATSVYALGIKADHYLLSSDQLWKFRKGDKVHTEEDIKARKGAYYTVSTHLLSPRDVFHWYTIAEVDLGPAEFAAIRKDLENPQQLTARIVEDIESNTHKLDKLVGMADGIQCTNDKLGTGRHFSNVLFNIMRGGVFEDHYQIDREDFCDFVHTTNHEVYLAHKGYLESLTEELNYLELKEAIVGLGDDDLLRLVLEYLPLTFSRRHGDPSRPWNSFNINLTDNHGKKVRGFEGNWRDIFQNWEALLYSFPAYVEGIITKFLNASTIDGYNPYRITRDGIDWEVIEPEDPWSYIGYWGDHQIIYLLKFLEHSEAHYPGKLAELLRSAHFVYARVPYRIKSYQSIVRNPFDTVDYDHGLAADIDTRVELLGSDGKLIPSKDTHFLRANLTEKILVSLLTKLYNFIPEAGIWMNTQRPEWNDANNALVGNGVSMVTLYYIRRFALFLNQILDQAGSDEIHVNRPVAELFQDLHAILESHQEYMGNGISNEERKTVCDALGSAGDMYRGKAYSGFSGDLSSLTPAILKAFLRLVVKHLDHSIAKNKREDGLYHSYNLINFTRDGLSINHLYEMLEGQVAVLSSGFLSSNEASVLLDHLKDSEIFRPDQFSYMLYPKKELKGFLHKNIIPEALAKDSRLIQHLLESGDNSIVVKDVLGAVHFNPDFHNVTDLHDALKHSDSIHSNGMELTDQEKVEEIFEEIFQHKSFTGRSGTFFGYEGIGSIYWHMVSKLLLAVQENIYRGFDEGISEEAFGNMVDHYYEIRAGIGVNKSPELYGAFPTDAYSHTPINGGARQPGLTGQVKEDVLNRWAELGVKIKDGRIKYEPIFLQDKEWLNAAESFEYVDEQGERSSLELKKGSLGFTYLQVPVIYLKSSHKLLRVVFENGESQEFEGTELDEGLSAKLFARNSGVRCIEVELDL